MKQLLIHLLRLLVIATMIALVYGGIRFILSLLSVCDTPTFWNIASCAIGIFLFMVLCGLYNVCLMAYRGHKDPLFKEMHIRTGISWENYKRLRKTTNGR